MRLSQNRPSREQLHEAIREHRALFRPAQYDRLTEQRRLALESMQHFAGHRPRLIGSLVDGDGPLDQITLLLLTDTIEEVIHDLEDRHIPWRSAERTLQHAHGQRIPHPAVRFEAGASTVELVVPGRQLRSNPPRDPIDGRPLSMLSPDQVAALIAAD